MRTRSPLALLIVAAGASCFAVTLGSTRARAAAPPLIPREELFGNPERTQPRLSPDGKHLAWLQADPQNVLQVYWKTLGQSDDKVAARRACRLCPASAARPPPPWRPSGWTSPVNPPPLRQRH